MKRILVSLLLAIASAPALAQWGPAPWGPVGTDAFSESSWTTLSEGVATSLATLTFAASTAVGAELFVLVEANDGTEYQSLTSRLRVSSVRKATGNTVSTVNLVGTDLAVASSGTLVCTFTTANGTAAVTVKAACTSSLTQTVLRASYRGAGNGPVTIAGL